MYLTDAFCLGTINTSIGTHTNTNLFPLERRIPFFVRVFGISRLRSLLIDWKGDLSKFLNIHFFVSHITHTQLSNHQFNKLQFSKNSSKKY